jgi:hypothetical protein
VVATGRRRAPLSLPGQGPHPEAIAEKLELNNGRPLTDTADEIQATATVLNQEVGEHGEDAALVLALKALRDAPDADVRAMVDPFLNPGEPSRQERFSRISALDDTLANRVTVAVQILSHYLNDAETTVGAKQKESGAATALTDATAVITAALESLDSALEGLAR